MIAVQPVRWSCAVCSGLVPVVRCGCCRCCFFVLVSIFCAPLPHRAVKIQNTFCSLIIGRRVASAGLLASRSSLVVFSVLVLFVSCDVSVVTSFSFASLLFLLFAGSTRVGSGSWRLFGKSGTTSFLKNVNVRLHALN